MSKRFLSVSAILFIGGILLAAFEPLPLDASLVLGIILMLMGGIPLICVWFKELFQFLPEETANNKSNKK